METPISELISSQDHDHEQQQGQQGGQQHYTAEQQQMIQQQMQQQQQRQMQAIAQLPPDPTPSPAPSSGGFSDIMKKFTNMKGIVSMEDLKSMLIVFAILLILLYGNGMLAQQLSAYPIFADAGKLTLVGTVVVAVVGAVLFIILKVAMAMMM